MPAYIRWPTMYEMVKDFHTETLLEVRDTPIDMKELHPHGPTSNSPLWRLRMALVREEFDEFCEAMVSEDLVKIADAIMDLHYVLSGTSVSFGIPEDRCFEEVHRSNMSKLDKDENGEIRRREDGKILKGPNFSEPDLHSIIYGQKS